MDLLDPTSAFGGFHKIPGISLKRKLFKKTKSCAFGQCVVVSCMIAWTVVQGRRIHRDGGQHLELGAGKEWLKKGLRVSGLG